MNIIDSHIHICRCINGFGNSGEMQAIGGGYASYADGTIFQMIPECLGEYDVTPEAVLKVMDEAGVSKAVMLQGNFLGPQNLYTYEAAKKYPDRLAAAATYDPFCRNVDSIRKHLFEDLGIKIVKFEVSTGSGLMSYHPTIALDGDVIEDEREYLSDEELQALEKENSFISEKKARKLIKNCKYIRFNKELVLSKAYLSNYVDTKGEIRPSKVFDYKYTTDDETKDSISLSVKMDAYSGKIISFSKSYNYGENSPNKITEPVKYDKALPIAKEAAEYFAEDIAEEYRPGSAWEKDSESVSRNVWFTRYVNDIPAYFDDMSVSVNSNGEVLGFEYDYHKLVFPEPDLVGTEAAYEKLFKKMKPELYYTGFTDLQLRSHVYLTYRFDEDFLINALTGERITGSGEQYYTDKMYKAEDVKEPKLYTDIKGHKYEKEISTLWNYGVRISDNEKLGPDEPITVSEFEKLIGYTEYDGYFNYFSNHIYQSIRQETKDGSGYTLLRNPKLDKALTYGDLAKLYVLMYEDECYTAAGIKGIYAPPFENIPTSDPDCGYIAIAKAKELIKDGRRFDKNKTITRADALKIYYDYISGNKVKDIKSIFAV